MATPVREAGPEGHVGPEARAGELGGNGAGDGSGAGDYLVDHSAAIILFDPQGMFRALFGMPHQPQHMVSDFQAIRQYYEAIQ